MSEWLYLAGLVMVAGVMVGWCFCAIGSCDRDLVELDASKRRVDELRRQLRDFEAARTRGGEPCELTNAVDCLHCRQLDEWGREMAEDQP